MINITKKTIPFQIISNEHIWNMLIKGYLSWSGFVLQKGWKSPCQRLKTTVVAVEENLIIHFTFLAGCQHDSHADTHMRRKPEASYCDRYHDEGSVLAPLSVKLKICKCSFAAFLPFYVHVTKNSTSPRLLS